MSMLSDPISIPIDDRSEFNHEFAGSEVPKLQEGNPIPDTCSIEGVARRSRRAVISVKFFSVLQRFSTSIIASKVIKITNMIVIH